MKSLKQSGSISVKLSIIVATIVFFGVFLISAIFIVQDFRETVISERVRLENISTAFSAASADPLLNDDKQAQFQVLRGIRDVQNVTFIAVKHADGRAFAEMGSSVSLKGRDGIIDEKSFLSLVSAATLIAETPIRSGGLEIGTLSIHADISGLRNDYISKLIILALVGFLASAVIAVVTHRAIRSILRPLNDLSGELISLGDNPDLSHRFDYGKDDEIGVLTNAFNDAFARIEQRDMALRRHKDSLEKTVDRRTRDLRTAMEEAKRANAAKSDFLATMSHEIRTPMNGMMVMAELLAASPLAPRHQRYAEVISRSGNALLNIINDILDMSKIEAGKLELEQIPFSLDTLMEDTVSLFQSRAREKNLALALCIAPDVATDFIGDPTRLGQIISNLTNNALKFTETGGVTLKVTHGPEQASGAQSLRIEVIDTGIGIAEDKLQSVFEAFSQADQTVTRKFGGTGLGLSISQRLAHAFGGEITVRSEAGKGTVFTFELSLVAKQASPWSTSEFAGMTIGMFDASCVSGGAISEALQMRSVNVAQLGEDEPHGDLDLIVINANDGKSFLPLRHSRYAGTPLVVLDGSGSGAFGIAAQLEADAILPLPLSRTNIDHLLRATRAGDLSPLDEADVRPSLVPLPTEDFSRIRVLAVDDNAINREVLNEALSALKVKAVFAASGEEAVDLAKAQDFDMIFMDCSMPGMDGYQATSLIREHEAANNARSATIIALTAHVTGREAERWKDAGMDGHMAKPFTVNQLSNALQNLSQRTPEKKAEPRAVDITIPDFICEQSPLNPQTLAMFETVGASNGTDMAARIFPMFIEQVGEGFEAVRKAVLDNEDVIEAKDLLHALKSMCNSSGVLRGASWCGLLEEKAREGELPHEREIEILDQLLNEACAAMKEHMDGNANPSGNATKVA